MRGVQPSESWTFTLGVFSVKYRRAWREEGGREEGGKVGGREEGREGGRSEGRREGGRERDRERKVGKGGGRYSEGRRDREQVGG